MCVLIGVRLRDCERLTEPQLAVFGVVVDEPDRCADLVGAGPEVMAGEQVMRGPNGEIAELDRVACVHELGGAAVDVGDLLRVAEAATAVAGGEDLADP